MLEQLEFAKSGCGIRGAERWEFWAGIAWLLLGTLAKFVKKEFGIRKVEMSGFGRQEAERWGVTWLGWEIREAGESAFAWSLIATLAQFVEMKFAFEFEKRKAEKSEFAKREPICLESGTREAEMVGLAWLQLATLAQFGKARVSRAFEFGKLEFGRPGVET